eukprot:1965436-Pleurochrysis_carterae.AAC.1
MGNGALLCRDRAWPTAALCTAPRVDCVVCSASLVLHERSSGFGSQQVTSAALESVVCHVHVRPPRVQLCRQNILCRPSRLCPPSHACPLPSPSHPTARACGAEGARACARSRALCVGGRRPRRAHRERRHRRSRARG